MTKHNHHTQHRTPTQEASSLAEDARALVAATAEVAGGKVAEARQRLILALENAKEMAGNVRDKAVAGAKATDKAVRKHPYKAIAIAVGTGALIGCAVARRQRKAA
jgi:ElaB/YqjD/DUF883 family membrane-anchored ribosome-binding protein